MWNALVAALLSAAAALGGVTLSARLSARSQTRQWQHEREQRLRDEKLKIASEIVTRSARIRERHLKLLNPASIMQDTEQIEVDYQELRNLVSTLRLTARNFATVSTALELADDAALVIKGLEGAEAKSQAQIAPATLRLAAMRLREEALVELVRGELDLKELEGKPAYDEDVVLKAFLEKALSNKKDVEKAFGDIHRLRNKAKDASWLAK
ncbi:hypothetical protein [Nonomuraea sp. NPDC048916]|uniref:hypothetical protein n=1 Tax=Nonomuraea sp. NPDC048916 TaxID=3154232 RepID=UPI0033C38DEB